MLGWPSRGFARAAAGSITMRSSCLVSSFRNFAVCVLCVWSKPTARSAAATTRQGGPLQGCLGHATANDKRCDVRGFSQADERSGERLAVERGIGRCTKGALALRQGREWVEDRWLYRWWRHTIDTNFEFKRRDGRLPVCTDRVSC